MLSSRALAAGAPTSPSQNWPLDRGEHLFYTRSRRRRSDPDLPWLGNQRSHRVRRLNLAPCPSSRTVAVRVPSMRIGLGSRALTRPSGVGNLGFTNWTLADQIRQPIDLIHLGDGRPEHQLVGAGVHKCLNHPFDCLGRRGQALCDHLSHGADEAVIVAQIHAAALVGVFSQREIACADEERLARPASLLPDALRHREALLGPLWTAAAPDIAGAPARQPRQRLRRVAPHQYPRPARLHWCGANRAGALGCWPAGPDAMQRLQLPAEAAPP